MKPFKMLAVTTVFTSGVVVACSGSTTSNSPPGNGDSGVQQGTDSGPDQTDSSTAPDANTADANTRLCTPPTTGCATGQVCCAGATASTCIAQGATCQGIAATCTTTASCTGGQVCCGSFSGLSAKADCQAGPCAAGAYELCTADTDCQNGQTCQSIVVMGFTVPGLKQCAAPVADGGSGDASTTTDSSTPVDASDDGG